MKTAGDNFFYQATLRICGSLDLETMLSDCYAFVRNTIPANGLSMSVYDLEAKGSRKNKFTFLRVTISKP